MSNNDKNKVSIKAPIVPDGGWGWLIVFASFMIHFVMDGITYSMGQVFLEPMRKELSLDRASVSSIFGILPAVTLGAGPIATVLTNMYGCRTVAIAGTCIASLGFFLSRMWANIWFYYITIGVIGGMLLHRIEQIDLNLLKNSAFTLFTISNFLTSLGFNVVYNFADDLANDSNVIKDQRSYIVMSIGLSNIFGRLIIGYFGDRKCVNRLLLFILTLIISGVATMIAPLCGSSVISHIGYASFFGFFSGGSVTLTAIVLIDIVGIDKLSDAFGVVLLFVGVATAIGTPIVGGMRDAFSHFTRPFLWPYLIFGSCTVISGVILFAIPFLQRKKPSDVHIEMDVNKFYSGKDRLSQEQQQKV
ncbi:unnamed protein product [Rotaria sordida]|uniref:Major facilitator superfamily (MFS) profile domain-containing protein n=1 Tax=Rotaria sordida TaxID=392033 RepID=A0A815FIA5_9BILA|nr:unnamed protein product [Rotaria sordida]